MSFLDRIAAVLAPAASDEQRLLARQTLETLAHGEAFAQEILSQHRAIEAIFADVRHSSGPAAQAIVSDLAVLLNAHAMAEEAVIYPEVSHHSSKVYASIAYEEHAMIKVKLAELQQLQPGTQEWHEKIDHIETAVQQHVYREESTWLPDVIRFAPVDTRRRMGVDFNEYFGRVDLK